MLPTIFIFMIFTSVVQSLIYPSCEFQLKIGDSDPKRTSLPVECELSEEDIGLYKLFLSIEYFINNVYVWWSPISNSIVTKSNSIINSNPKKRNKCLFL
ncbi:unnamed protein product [Adineta ricciae]|uniref:Uncharacterized protein n=1 Tax=Adineta ricciae TaxID=249248 RepID=A0A815MF94_ADIRI|nr:unnamed protein product [Adineta ricciae]